MKNIFFSLLGIIILFSACSQDETRNVSSIEKQKSSQHFYGVKTIEETRGVAQLSKLWYPGTIIDIKFLNGTDIFKQKVKTYAAEWEQYAYITFNFIEEGDANVRIAFDSNDSRFVTWSTTGTDCKMIANQSEPTMNFVDWDYLYEEEIKGDVLRAFGQVLGLELEHRHIDFDAGWRDNISLYWEGSIEDIPWSELKQYVFDPLDSSRILETDEYDENSIMIWPFPRQFALNTARDYNFELSKKDKEFISRIYSQENIKEQKLVLLAEVKKGVSFDINNRKIKSDFLIDWGDGTTEYFSSYVISGRDLYHRYDDESLYTLKIYGDENEIDIIYFQGEYILSFDPSGSKNLEELNIYGELKSIDISNNSSLHSLSISSSLLENLDLTNNIKLRKLSLYESQLTYLDVSTITYLRELNCDNSKLTSLDLSNNSHLMYLSCNDNQLSSLDLSENIQLNELGCRNNQLTQLVLPRHGALRKIYCDNNKLTSMDVSNRSWLEELSCSHNQIEILAIPSSLKTLNCGNNLITSLDVSNNSYQLKNLYCSNNRLTGLNISNNIPLVFLSCDGNQINSLDLSNNIHLTNLDCNNNLLSSLDLSNNNLIRWVVCQNNPFNAIAQSMIDFANSLPNCPGGVYRGGTIYYGNQFPEENVNLILPILATKNWKI